LHLLLERFTTRSKAIDFYLPHLHSTSPLEGSRWNIVMALGTEKLEWLSDPTVKNVCWPDNNNIQRQVMA